MYMQTLFPNFFQIESEGTQTYPRASTIASFLTIVLKFLRFQGAKK